MLLQDRSKVMPGNLTLEALIANQVCGTIINHWLPSYLFSLKVEVGVVYLDYLRLHVVDDHWSLRFLHHTIVKESTR
jgi:hypothetical protein